MNEREQAIMQLILHSGSAKTHAYEALRQVNEGKYEKADEEMQLANDEITSAHNAQTSLLQEEAAGGKMEITGLFLHAQDHLMTTISEMNLIKQIMELRKIVNDLLEDKIELRKIVNTLLEDKLENTQNGSIKNEEGGINGD